MMKSFALHTGAAWEKVTEEDGQVRFLDFL
jgi:hypothetical protein